MKQHKENAAVKTKRLLLKPMTADALTARIDGETDAHLKEAYAQMRDGVIASPDHALWYTAWRMERREDGVSVGDLCFFGPPEDLTVTIGYGVEEAYRRQGYCKEALEALTKWAFGQAGVYYIRAKTEPDNEASAHLLEKAGFKRLDGIDGESVWEKEKPPSSYLTIMMCLGISVGMTFGLTLFDNIGVGMCLGVAVGVAIGAALDAADKKARVRKRGASSVDML